jgi:hypothetical protein
MLWEAKNVNLTYLLHKFLAVTMDPLNIVSRNVAVYKNTSMTLNTDLLDAV